MCQSHEKYASYCPVFLTLHGESICRVGIATVQCQVVGDATRLANQYISRRCFSRHCIQWICMPSKQYLGFTPYEGGY